MQTADEENVTVGLRRLLAMAGPEALWLTIAVLASAVLGAVRPLFAVLLAAALSLLQPASSAADAGRVAVFFVALAALQLVLSIAQVRLRHTPLFSVAAIATKYIAPPSPAPHIIQSRNHEKTLRRMHCPFTADM